MLEGLDPAVPVYVRSSSRSRKAAAVRRQQQQQQQQVAASSHDGSAGGAGGGAGASPRWLTGSSPSGATSTTTRLRTVAVERSDSPASTGSNSSISSISSSGREKRRRSILFAHNAHVRAVSSPVDRSRWASASAGTLPLPHDEPLDGGDGGGGGTDELAAARKRSGGLDSDKAAFLAQVQRLVLRSGFVSFEPVADATAIIKDKPFQLPSQDFARNCLLAIVDHVLSRNTKSLRAALANRVRRTLLDATQYAIKRIGKGDSAGYLFSVLKLLMDERHPMYRSSVEVALFDEVVTSLTQEAVFPVIRRSRLDTGGWPGFPKAMGAMRLVCAAVVVDTASCPRDDMLRMAAAILTRVASLDERTLSQTLRAATKPLPRRASISKGRRRSSSGRGGHLNLFGPLELLFVDACHELRYFTSLPFQMWHRLIVRCLSANAMSWPLLQAVATRLRHCFQVHFSKECNWQHRRTIVLLRHMRRQRGRGSPKALPPRKQRHKVDL